MGVVTFCTRQHKFKHGTGQFNYIFDLKENRDRTVKFKFDYLEKHPLRKHKVSKFSLGLPLRNPYAPSPSNAKPNEDFYDSFDKENNAVLVMELHDYNDDFTHQEIKARTQRI